MTKCSRIALRHLECLSHLGKCTILPFRLDFSSSRFLLMKIFKKFTVGLPSKFSSKRLSLPFLAASFLCRFHFDSASNALSALSKLPVHLPSFLPVHLPSLECFSRRTSLHICDVMSICALPFCVFVCVCLPCVSMFAFVCVCV